MPTTVQDPSDRLPRVAIITRTRNRVTLLARALEAVRAQTMTDYVLVIVNDAGRREPVDQLVAAQPQDFRERIHLVHNEVSNGREAALAVGFKAADSQYVTILDDDDTWEPSFLETTVAHLEAHPEQAAVAARADIVRESLDEEGVAHVIGAEPLAADQTAWSLLESLVGNYVPTNSQVIRRSAAAGVGTWDGSLQTQADWEFNLRLLARWPVGFVDRQSLAEASGDADGDPDLGGYLLAAEYYKRLRDQVAGSVQDLHEGRELSQAHLLKSVDSLHTGLGQVLYYVQKQEEEMRSLREEVARLRTDHVQLHQEIHQLRLAQQARAAISRIRSSLPGSGQSGQQRD